MRDYYFMITLTWPTPLGVQFSERRGTVKLRVGQSRQNAVEDVIRWIAEQVGAPEDHVVLFFSLEPNELAA
ncbi:hypothetical protein [Nocardia thailandica]|uniref:hypothetical protein n=1 Tax=Nocardia thailandica TaxID=257275 RepID=UPI0002E8F364|nr:hypothetical protein [Nocardia thailandica]